MGYASGKAVEKREMIAYDEVSFLAEVGGAMGLFLGFSMLMVWDIALDLRKRIVNNLS